MPFDEFASYVESLGYPRASGRSGIEQRGPGENGGTESAVRPLPYNLALCIRYPFIVPKGPSGDVLWIPHAGYVMRYSKREQKPPFSVTELDQISAGWRARFALEFCEDFFSALVASEETGGIAGSALLECKNKFGTLKTYYCGPETAISKMRHVGEEYERLSEIVCETCGSIDCVRMCLRGWVTPICRADTFDRYSGGQAGTGSRGIQLGEPEAIDGAIEGDVFKKLVHSQMEAEKGSGVARLDPALTRCLTDNWDLLPERYEMKSFYDRSSSNRVEKTRDYPWDRLCVSKVFAEAIEEGLASRKELVLELMDGGIDDRDVMAALGHFLSNGGRP